MYLAYSVLLALALVLSLPYWLIQMITHHKYRAGFKERFGILPARLKKDTERSAIWVHAVSVGEVLAVAGLIEKIPDRLAGHQIFVSTTTDTGQRLAREKFGPGNVFYFPLDFAFAIRPYLRFLRPELVVIAETEFWPNFLRLCRGSDAKVVIVNARISDRSFRGYRRIRTLLRRILRPIDLFLAQTEEDRKRLIDIGAPADRARAVGNLKFDLAAPVPPAIVESLRATIARVKAGPVIVAGSTMEGEEALLLRAFEIVRSTRPRAVLILAPRHPQRFAEVASLVESLGIVCWRRSLWSGEDPAGCVLLLDSIGELGPVYSLAQLAFVGGSLVEHGGHNILEPARYGVPIVIGPHYENFREMVNSFRQANAIRVVGPAELPLVFGELLTNEKERQSLGDSALKALRSQSGATGQTLQALEAVLEKT
ncbi:MAG TPA: 3-deoxy-D-manno-octulosonic acid transferase [Terriglobales bacterium]|nr:3-deoxy-D-manno-octulosonic acid transferase [Terriglobales bacterium]